MSSERTVHGDVHVYPEGFDPNRWRFSIERVVLYICGTILLLKIIVELL